MVFHGAPAGAQEIVPRAERANASSYQPGAPVPAPNLTQRAVLVDPNKRLGVGDQVSVEIVEDREAPVERMITATGDLEVPPLDRVHVAGMTTAAAAAEIKRRLESEYYYRATVKLSINQVNVFAALGKVQISGEVRAPGIVEFNLADPPMLSEAILKLGGFKEFAKPEKVLVTRFVSGAKQEYEVNVKAILKSGSVDKDIKLEDGDRVHVPKSAFRF